MQSALCSTLRCIRPYLCTGQPPPSCRTRESRPNGGVLAKNQLFICYYRQKPPLYIVDLQMYSTRLRKSSCNSLHLYLKMARSCQRRRQRAWVIGSTDTELGTEKVKERGQCDLMPDLSIVASRLVTVMLLHLYLEWFFCVQLWNNLVLMLRPVKSPALQCSSMRCSWRWSLYMIQTSLIWHKLTMPGPYFEVF